MDTHDPAPTCPGATTCTSEPIYHALLDRWRHRGLTLPGTTPPVLGLMTYGDGAAPGLVAVHGPDRPEGTAGTEDTEDTEDTEAADGPPGTGPQPVAADPADGGPHGTA
ncbi:hypothetical protein [Kitasatospora sp. NPDC088346]|uniref:hypothetical protein n=1 Tax=Kitasatospora sp. NPDC088346 TaxID=3364073 RepID=UPI003815CEB1